MQLAWQIRFCVRIVRHVQQALLVLAFIAKLLFLFILHYAMTVADIHFDLKPLKDLLHLCFFLLTMNSVICLQFPDI
jgi:hypothetical protein